MLKYDPKYYSDIDATEPKDFNFMILDELFLPKPCPYTLDMMNDTFIDYVFDYQAFIKSLQKNDDLYSIVCNNCDFDIRAYFSEELKVTIENALTTEAQKDNFKTFLESKNETNKDTKKEEPIPSCEKEDSEYI